MQTLTCGEDVLTSLHHHVPGLVDAPDEEKLAAIERHLSIRSEFEEQIAGGPSVVATMSRADIGDAFVTQVRTAFANQDRQAAEITTLRSQLAEMSRSIIKPPDEETIAGMKTVCGDLAEQSVRAGLNPAIRDEIYSILVQDQQGRTNITTMSRASSQDGKHCVAYAVFRALAKNKPMSPLGEQTGLQVMSRSVPEETDEERGKKEAGAMLAKYLNAGAPVPA